MHNKRIKSAKFLFLIPILIQCNPFLKTVDEPDLSSIKLPPGFVIELYASDIENARSMAMGAEGTLFVGTKNEDRVYALVDENNDNRVDKKYIIAEGLTSPNGVAFKDEDLYVAERSRILRYDNIESRLAQPPQATVVFDAYPTESHHGWKYIAFGPDDKLYVPVGAPCNICLEENPVFASITRMDADGSNMEIFAEGIRNTVGFDWHPQTGELWFTENGTDWMGNNEPLDELNKAPERGMHFGFPFCHNGIHQDSEYDSRGCDEFVGPEINLGPHVAALGMKFYTGDMFPEKYKNQVFIAEHGSWNRIEPIGYRISLVEMENGQAKNYTTFAEGWLDGSRAWGRPVDILQLPDGSLLVSDDHANAIYRISYKM